MTSFVHVDQPQVHPGVHRAEVLFSRFGTRAGSRHLLALLLIAVVTMALVLADTLVSNWSESHLLAAWVVLCGALFAGVALYAAPIRDGALRLTAGFRDGAQRRAAARADARFLQTAQDDPRVMQELRAAILRRKSELEVADEGAHKALDRMAQRIGADQMPTLYEAMRRMNASRRY